METLTSKRIFVAGLFHETNTFVEQFTRLEHFRVTCDAAILDLRGNDSPMAGLLESATEFGWQIVPGVFYQAAPSGPVLDEVFETYWRELLPRLKTGVATGLDAITLILHGAMATVGCDDVEGELLQRIRMVSEGLPIFAVLDLHANVSELMANCATALIPYRENPHTDARETALRVARHLHQYLEGKLELRTHYLHSRILLPPPLTGTAEEPMRSLQRMARALEESEGHLEIGIAPGFAHADTPDTGLTFWVISDQEEANCRWSLECILQEARRLIRDLRSDEWSLPEAMRRIEEERRFPALLVEPADNIGGGTSGDATFVLRALLESSIEKGGVILNDPAAVARLASLAIGETLRLSLGGRDPLELEVTLLRRSEGRFDLEDKQSHLASMGGRQIDMGPCAVVSSRNVTILLTSRATPPFDLGQWRSQGVEPSELQVIGVKAAVGHRRAYDPIARSSYTVSTPGPGTSDLSSLPYRKIKRPIYPLDA